MIRCRLFSKRELFSKTPHRRRYEKWKRCRDIVFYVFLLLSIILFILYLATYFDRECKDYTLCPFPTYVKDTLLRLPILTTAFSTVFIGIITFLWAETNKLNVLAEEEEAQVRLFNSELKDFVRHLQANLRVLIRIKEELDKGKSCIQNIHFENLKWPESSSLLSNKMATLVDTGKNGGTFFQLELRIRNLNNGADWLKEVNSLGKMKRKFLEYEINRHFKLLIEFYYLEKTVDNAIGENYRFPEGTVTIGEDYEEIIKKCFQGYSEEEAKAGIDKLKKRYCDSDTKKREVLVS